MRSSSSISAAGTSLWIWQYNNCNSLNHQLCSSFRSPYPARRATVVADRLGVDFALINRNRHKGDGPDEPGRMELLVGDVKDKVSSYR